MTVREIATRQRGRASADGAGVRLLRVFGGNNPRQFDPFLMLDEFGSDRPEDYAGGFPDHPHRGFETVTYMLAGKMEHRDHLGNRGLLDSGGVQWMTAGSGIIHSEMPLQTEGLMHGFQLWINLPAATKMQPARYEDVAAEQLPRRALDGLDVVAIAGNLQVGDQSISGYFKIPDRQINFFDLHLHSGTEVTLTLPSDHQVLLYSYSSEVDVGTKRQPLARGDMGQLSEGSSVLLRNPGSDTARVLLLSGLPLNEPVVQYGPFVMNNREEIEQALDDYRRGQLT